MDVATFKELFVSIIILVSNSLNMHEKVEKQSNWKKVVVLYDYHFFPSKLQKLIQ